MDAKLLNMNVNLLNVNAKLLNINVNLCNVNAKLSSNATFRQQYRTTYERFVCFSTKFKSPS